ncbi:MAG: prolyl-tRNA synthetase associated domain-containing protein [Clostridiales bacterium]|nr:prolyl-tRNA synthetase associated domain-containing protein [Clostridiales bacterium]
MGKLQIIEGKPENLENRLEKEIETYELLEKLNIPFRQVDHPAAMTMEDCRDVEELFHIHVVKNLFLCNRQKTKYYLLLMPGEKIFKTKELSSQIGTARLSFASPEAMETYLNLTPGSVTVMGLQFDHNNKVQLLIDEEILGFEYIGCHPSVNTSSIVFRTSDLVEKYLPAVHHEMIRVKLIGE